MYTKKVINKAKEVYKYINSDEYLNKIKITKNILPEDYISQLEVDESVKKNSKILNHLKKLKIDFDVKDEDKKLVKIPNYEMVSKFEKGDTFGELDLENLNKKRKASIIALTNCDFAIINKKEYNELIKESVNKTKNKFYNLIYKYKIFDSISTTSFDKKYYNHFKHLKLKKNSILFNSGDICNQVYFILNGEFELFVDKNIQEVNQIILQLKDIIDELKKIIIQEEKAIINENNKTNNNNISLKIKNNLNLFFSKFEKEINLEEVAFIINNRDIINKKKYLGNNFNKIISEKKRIKLGIYKSIQIIGLNDIINRFHGNDKCFFSCKCFSFSGELYYIDYNKFLRIYEDEENVKLYTSQLIYQNIFYIIGRLLSHKKYIYEKAIIEENDIINSFHLEDNNQNISKNIDNNKKAKNIINIMKKAIKNNSIINNHIKSNDFINFSNKKIFDINNRIDPLSLSNQLNLYDHINILKMDNNYNNSIYCNNLSENKKNEKNENLNINNSSSSNNNISKIESHIFSKNSNKKKIKNIYRKTSNLMINKKYKSLSRNLLNTKNYSSKTKITPHNLEKKIEFPTIVINDNEVKINENKLNSKINNKNSFTNLLKSIISKNKKFVDLINSKEIKNIALYSDRNDSIEMKYKFKNLFRRKKVLLLSRNNLIKYNIKNNVNKNIKLIHNYSEKKNLYSTSYKSDDNKFLTYSLSDLNGKHHREIKFKINESISSERNTNKDNIFNNTEKNKIFKDNNNFQSINYRNNYFKFKYKSNTSPSPLNHLILKKNMTNTFYSNRNYNNNNLQKI